MKNSPHLSARLAVPVGAGVDPQTGRMSNLALMTIGEALGHGFYIDQITLETCLAAITRIGGRLRGYLTHNHEGPTGMFWDCADDMEDAYSELNMAGFFSGLAIKKDQLNAATFEFFDAFRANYKPQYDQLVEMAAKTPDLIGLSVEIWYHLVYVGTDGTEYAAEPEGVDLAYNGLPVARIDECFAAAFGAVVAANPGLFSRLSATLKKLVAGREIPPAEQNTVAAATHNKGPLSSSDSSPLMKIIADLQAKFGSDEKKLAAAMLIVGKTPSAQVATLTVEAIEAEMMKADLSASNAQVAKLTGDLSAAADKVKALEKQVSDLTASRDDFKQKFEQIKGSGAENPADLGSTSAGAGTADENPFVTGNLAAQARLTKSDPARAAALKAAAKTAKK